ncbi:MAG: HlyD family efflux transporter periplasmic adaptor subunit [bacterium]|nr:HlyD family efflux transporter periplasmic adaptor subunit [bacterium]
MTEISRNERVLGPLKVGLRSDLHFTRQETRGGPRYIAHDPVTFQNHAFSVADYQVISAIVRRRSLTDTFEELVHRGVLEDTEEDKQGFYKFVLWLHGAGLLHLPIANGDLLFDRHLRRRSQKHANWYQVFLNHKIPLGNPDGFLRRTMGWVGWLFTMPGFLLWLGLIAVVAWKCVGRFDEMFEQTSTMLAISNLPLLWGAMIVLKAIHEFGHAYACRRFGAPVPEMGVVMIMMTPCAYVDASASWRLMRRRQRATVALAGMYVESIVAAFAALVWLGTPPGFVHDLAFNVVALASVVTVLFNINPLMKYDGYYLFSDVVGVFNLQQRATTFFSAWVSHFALGSPRPEANYARSERWLYLTYGPATFAYRVFLAFAITTLVMLQWPGAGLFLGTVFLYALAVMPVCRLLSRLWHQDVPTLRTRSRLVAIGLATIVPIMIAILPISWHVTAPGIVDPRTSESVRAPTAGFVKTLAIENGQAVGIGQLLCELSNPDLEYRRKEMEGERAVEAESYDVVELEDPTQAAMHESRKRYLEAGVNELHNRILAMTLTASTAGTVTSAKELDWQGRFVQQGEELFQIQSGHRYLRVILTDEDVSRTRLEIGSTAEVRFTCNPDLPVSAKVREIRAAASRDEIPLPLTMLAGGDIYARPLGETSAVAVADEPYLHVLLEIDSLPVAAQGAGLTARVQFPARVELLGWWLQRRALAFWNSWRMS